jgi:hypothetical protein
MGIYNNIHDFNDDYYYYCPVNDCPCHSPDYYDSSRNYDNKYDYYNLVDDKYYNDKYNGGFTGYLN